MRKETRYLFLPALTTTNFSHCAQSLNPLHPGGAPAVLLHTQSHFRIVKKHTNNQQPTTNTSTMADNILALMPPTRTFSLKQITHFTSRPSSMRRASWRGTRLVRPAASTVSTHPRPGIQTWSRTSSTLTVLRVCERRQRIRRWNADLLGESAADKPVRLAAPDRDDQPSVLVLRVGETRRYA